MEGIAVEYSPNSIDTGNNEEKSKFHSYISVDNKQDVCDSHDHMFHHKKFVESCILVSSMSKVWEDTDGCANKYGCDLAIY